MSEWEGLIIPTYFITHVIRRRLVGPCVQIFMGVAETEGESPAPEVSFICPAPNLIRFNAETIAFLRRSKIAYTFEGDYRLSS